MTEENNKTGKDFSLIEKVLLQWELNRSGKPVIPALFRSKRATIIGDPEQFRPISKLTRERESRIWKQYFQSEDLFVLSSQDISEK